MKDNVEELYKDNLDEMEKTSDEIIKSYTLPKDAAILKKVSAKVEKIGSIYLGGEETLDEDIGIVINGPEEFLGKKFRLKKHFVEEIEINYTKYYFVDNLSHSYYYIIKD